ncbi:MAG: hypothetical protein RLZZ200_1502 [Pseudomonadota bacterium]|jgi:CheY-like chemotaxis protein
MAQGAASADNAIDCEYLLDAEDRLLSFHGGVDPGEYGVSTSQRNRPGQSDSLWDYLTDGTTRQLYAGLLAQVRRGRSVRFCLRCDSPESRRVLQMDMHPEEQGRVRFRTLVLALEPRPRVELISGTVPRHGNALRICGWCKKLGRRGAWLEAEDYIEAEGLFQQEHMPPLINGICPNCEVGVRNLLREGVASGLAPRVGLVTRGPFLRDIVGRNLERSGISLVAFTDAEAAIEALRDDRYGYLALLFDVDTPGSRTEAEATAATSRVGRTPVIWLSIGATRLLRQTADAAGVATLIQKDRIAEELAASIWAHTTGRAPQHPGVG